VTTPKELSMHSLTIQTKYTFGDRVRFDSASQGGSGTGRIFAITVDAQRQIDYIIEIDQGSYTDLQPGVLEHEIELL
jgi:hypothetical protein